jgi:molybdopterin synthase sulfur carrier subunit
VRLVYFAWVRERIGLADETVDVPAEIATVGELIGWLRRRGEQYENALGEPAGIRVALDQTHADLAAPLAGAREVALFPPMTGG